MPPRAASGSGQSVTVNGVVRQRNTEPLAQPPVAATGITPPVLLIAERNGDGHRLYYVSLIAAAAARHGFRTVVALSPDVSDELIEVHLADVAKVAEIVRVEASTVVALQAMADRLGASIVIVPDGDHLALELGRGRPWRSPARLRLLVLRWDAQRKGRRVAPAARLKVFAKRCLLRLASRRSRVEVFVLRSPLWRGRLGLPTVIDPVTVIASAEDTRRLIADWNLADDRVWLGVLGAVSARKNLDLIAAAMTAVPHRRLGLLVAGSVDTETAERLEDRRRELEATGHQVVVVNRLLRDAELDCAVAAVDVLMLAHSNDGPSGLLLKAHALGTTVIAAGAASLRDDLAAMRRSGDHWCELSRDSIARALAEVSPLRSRSFDGHGSGDSFARPLVGDPPA